MCQISVVIEKNDEQERIMENVTGLQVGDDGVILTSFFDEPMSVSDVEISRIDFLGGKVILTPAPHSG